MSIEYKLNKDKNGVEIKFSAKPSDKVRAKLKELGFRWSQFNGVWYAKQSEETIAFAKELAQEEGEQIAFEIDEEKEAPKKAEPKKEVKKAEPKKVEPIKKKVEPKKVEKSGNSSPKSEDKKTEKKDNIIVFPKKDRPKVMTRITDGSHTYEECEQKLGEERKIFKDSDSHYVFEGLLAMCKASQNFRNNVMDEKKTYSKAYDYFTKMAKDGYAFQYNGVTFLTMIWLWHLPLITLIRLMKSAT